LYPEYLKNQQELSFLSKEVKKYNSIDLFKTKAKIERQMIKREKALSEESSKTSHKLKFFFKILFYVIFRVRNKPCRKKKKNFFKFFYFFQVWIFCCLFVLFLEC